MFKNAAFAVTAAAGLAFALPAAAAVTVDYTSPQNIVLTAAPGGQSYAGSFSADLTGDGLGANPADFTATFFLNNPFADNSTAASVISVNGGGADVNFTSVTLDGQTFTITNGIVDTAVLLGGQVAPGPIQLILNGTLNSPTGVGSGSFGGNVTINAVPEPATWALFILGFGALGFAMRRRSSNVRVAKASLNFA
jgi:hypothetical protein